MSSTLRQMLARSGAGLALLVLALCSFSAPAQAKPPKGITWDVQLGYNKLAQKGRVNPVIVDMANNSAGTNLSGDLVLEYGGIEYSTRLELPTPSKKRFYLYFPCEDYPPTLTVRVRTKAYTEEKMISAFNSTIEASDLNVLVLSNQKGSLGVVNQQVSARMLRDIFNAEHAEVGAATVFVSYLRLDECEANPKFFSTADVIVLADVDYQQMNTEMAEALKAVLAGGKTLVFSLGLNGPAVSASPLRDICPLQVESTASVSSLGQFGQNYGISAERSPAILAAGSYGAGVEVLDWAGQRPVILRSSMGSGTAIALAFDFTQVPFKQNPRVADIFNDYVFRVDETVQLNNMFLHPQPLGNILSTLGAAKPMEPQFVLLFLLAYVVLIGPLNFFILDRFKRRTLVWTTIPLIVAGFSYLGLMTGYLRRGANNITAYFQEMHVFPGAAYTPYQTVMLVFTAERTKYELKVPDQSAFLYPTIPSPDPMNIPAQPGLGVFTGGRIDNSSEPLLKMTQGKWDPKVYYYQGYVAQQVGATSSLTGVRGEGGLVDLQGSFSLSLPFDLHNAYITGPGYQKSIGNLAGSGNFDIDSLSGESGGTQAGLSGDNYIAQRVSEIASRQQQSAKLPLSYRDEVLLVGFSEDIESLAKFDRAHKEHRLNMVVVHLPYGATVQQQGDLSIARGLLIGGKDFSNDDQRWGNFAPESGQGIEKVRFKPEGFVDVEYEIAGDLSRDSAIHVSLAVSDKNDNPVDDASNFMKVEIRSAGDWQPLAIADGTSVDVPVSMIGGDRRLTLRFSSLADEITFKLPDDRQSVY
ncbi:hypothetical protein IT575_06585 [bacterium]|nr:hypothetical protein [bacterium]